MTSLGASAFGGTITCDELRYTSLNPPIGGFVNNPLTGNLDGGNQNIINVNALTADTLNYTTLNPPIPTGFVTNPLAADLDCGNLNLTNINSLSATSGSFSSSTLGTAGFTTLTGGAVSAGTSTLDTNSSVGGTMSVGGLLTVNDGLTLNASPSPNQIQNKTEFGNEVKFLGLRTGTVASPIQLNTQLSGAYYAVTVHSPNYVLSMICQDATGQNQLLFDVKTAHNKVRERYVIKVNTQCLDELSITTTAEIQPAVIAPAQLTTTNDDNFSVLVKYGGTLGSLVKKFRVTVEFYYDP